MRFWIWILAGLFCLPGKASSDSSRGRAWGRWSETALIALARYVPMGFEQAITIVLAHEGGYVNDPADPGGETNFGISKRTYPHLDIANLTREEAVEIYRRDWWDKYGFDEFHPAVANKLFSLAVNMGWERAVQLLQGALWAVTGQELETDGVLGPKTWAVLETVSTWPTGPGMLTVALKSEAAGFYRQIARADRRKFLKGWLRRAYG